MYQQLTNQLPTSQVATVVASLRAYQLVVVLLQHSRLLLATQDGTTTLSPLAQVGININLFLIYLRKWQTT